MRKSDDISYRAKSVARVIDRLKPGDYVIHLTLPPRYYAEPFAIKIEAADLTKENARAIKSE
jgi:hypothetical protein